ncbi:MAG: hypothetical protein A2252_08475 [Elusimicrobia bacterium RIFOXYA2_FULL_39_19]|nr:MAG: hypothetical protein A2252_08475 [Elusimicrobia bacterium RIFOXYA2_FULL_39_19]
MNLFFEGLKNQILSLIAFLLFASIGYTTKVKKINTQFLEKAREKSKNVIYAFWHGRQFLLIFTHRFSSIYIMTSYSKDGELQTCFVKKLGYKPVRGSHKKRGAIEGTIEMIKRIEEGNDASFAVDGPKGPVYKVKEGILFIAQKTNKPIIPITVSAKRKRIFNNWDQYLLPMPFNEAFIVYGNPVYIEKNDDLALKAVELENELNRITQEADELSMRSD